LRFALAFWSLRFGFAFWFCVLLIEDISCVLPRRDSAHFKNWLRFVSRPPAFCLKTSCVLSQDLLRFVSRLPAFCLKTFNVPVPTPDHLCLIGLTLPYGNNVRLYCQGKKNGVNILKSIDKGPFQMGTVREPLAEGTEGAPHLGQE
nr:retrovirus-related Pol polyprotein from transposon TNT 1-94 [Tanacetum cinerariifolium]